MQRARSIFARLGFSDFCALSSIYIELTLIILRVPLRVARWSCQNSDQQTSSDSAPSAPISWYPDPAAMCLLPLPWCPCPASWVLLPVARNPNVFAVLPDPQSRYPYCFWRRPFRNDLDSRCRGSCLNVHYLNVLARCDHNRPCTAASTPSCYEYEAYQERQCPTQDHHSPNPVSSRLLPSPHGFLLQVELLSFLSSCNPSSYSQASTHYTVSRD